MKKRNSKMWISIIKYCVSILALAVIGGFLFPLYDGSSIKQYEEPWYWIGCLIASFVAHIGVLYFDKINPRKMYHCVGMFTVVAVFPFCTIAFIVAVVCAASLENTTAMVLWLIFTILLYLFLIYALLHRGVAIYQCGKIRIFKFFIKTYQINLIDDCRLDYQGRKCTVHIIMDGKDHIFKTSALFTKRLEQELKLYTKTYEKELNAVIRKRK